MHVMNWLQKPAPEMGFTVSLDGGTPHTLAVIANMTPTKQDSISTAEIVALLYLLEYTVIDPMYDHHKIIPVSSGSPPVLPITNLLG